MTPKWPAWPFLDWKWKSTEELSSLHRNVFKKRLPQWTYYNYETSSPELVQTGLPGDWCELRFFELAPKGQDYFKQSIERLNYIVDQFLDGNNYLEGATTLNATFTQ